MDKKLLKKCLVGEFSWLRVIRSLALIYGCLSIFACSVADRMIFPAPESSYGEDEQLLRLAMADGTRISALHLVNPEARYTVLYSHGNAEDLGRIRGYLEYYRMRGFSLLAYDYPGYGTSGGSPSTRGACGAAEAALQYLMREAGIPPGRIIIHGRSVGGGPAHVLAERHPVAGLIAESTFVSAFRVQTVIPILPFDRLRNLARIDKVGCPVLVIHGLQDDIIPVWHGRKLYERARQPKRGCWLEGATHNWIPPAAERQYWQAIEDFAKLLDERAGH